MIVGLTGGIGAGKSYVADVFKKLNVPVYNSDFQAKELYKKPEIANQLVQLIGEEAFIDGQLNRKFVADKLFGNQELLQQWNAVIHPALALDFKEWVNAMASADYVLKEAAILFESGAHKDCDLVINVYADLPLRVSRVATRDGSSEQQIKERMQAQWTDRRRVEASDFVVYNNENQPILDQCLSIHENIISRLSKKA